MGIVIQDKYRRKGYSYKALLELEKIAFENNNISELSDIIPDNRISAIKAFIKAGFISKELESNAKQYIITKEMYYKIISSNIIKWKFGINNSYLINLVLSGMKTATTSIYDKNDVPRVDEISMLVHDNEECACLTRTKKIIITEFKNITWNLAKLEGENKKLEEWREEHKKFFRSINSNFNDDTTVLFEIFEVIR